MWLFSTLLILLVVVPWDATMRFVLKIKKQLGLHLSRSMSKFCLWKLFFHSMNTTDLTFSHSTLQAQSIQGTLDVANIGSLTQQNSGLTALTSTNIHNILQTRLVKTIVKFNPTLEDFRNEWATFRTAYMGLHPALVVCDLTQIPAEGSGCRLGGSWYPWPWFMVGASSLI